ncbi:MAG: diacylglycerol kinase family lipid kinase [Bacteroidetes bacterium]|nr:diacylglycerol kinase family lipid kinase [Bacteroidota bacterium]
MRIAFILHGKLSANSKLHSRLKDAFTGLQHHLFYTEFTGHTEQIAARCVAEGYSHVIVCAGDGSLNEAVNGFMKSGKSPSALPKLGILPFGTGNDFIKSIKSPNTFSGIRHSIESDKFKTVDVGVASLQDKLGHQTQRYFINIAEVGLGGTIAEKMSGSSKILGATLTFQYHILSTLLTYKPGLVTVTVNGLTTTGPLMNLVIANGRFFAGGLCVSPDSDLADGLLNLVTIGNVRTWDYIRNLPKLKSGHKIEHPEVLYQTSGAVSVSAPHPMPVDFDGELAGYTPLNLSVIPGSVQFIV